MKNIDQPSKAKHSLRRQARVISFQALYAYDFENKPLEQILKLDWLEDKIPGESLLYAKKIIKGTINNIDKIDEVIKDKLRNWDFARLALVDKAILRFSVYSLMFENDSVPDKVIINEAVEIVKEFGSEDSYKFINGILDAIKKNKKTG